MAKEYTRTYTSLGLIPILGSVLFHDSLENLLNFSISGDGADFFGELSPNHAFSGSQCLHLKTRTTGATTGDEVIADLLSHIPPSGQIKLTARFRSPDFTKISFLQFKLYLYDGTDLHEAWIRYVPGTPKWEYYPISGVATTIPGTTFAVIANAWHLVTLSIDFNSDLYKLFEINNTQVNLTDEAIYAATDGTLRHLLCTIHLTTAGNAPAEVLIDELSLTEN